MQKILTGTIILIVSLVSAAHANADLQKDIVGCYALQNDSDRLDCYDTVSKYYKINPAQHADKAVSPAILPAKSDDAITKTSPLPQTEQFAITTPKADSPPEVAPVVDSFGQTKIDQEIQSIQSRLIGKFTGWKKGMKITLENGEVWKVTSNSRGFKKMNNPMVTISRGVFGSFNAKVEGLNASVKVKQIK